MGQPTTGWLFNQEAGESRQARRCSVHEDMLGRLDMPLNRRSSAGCASLEVLIGRPSRDINEYGNTILCILSRPPQVARLMQVYLFRMEPALRHQGVSPCHCRSSGLGRWDSRLVCGASGGMLSGRVTPFLVILTPSVAPLGRTPQWSR